MASEYQSVSRSVSSGVPISQNTKYAPYPLKRHKSAFRLVGDHDNIVNIFLCTIQKLSS